MKDHKRIEAAIDLYLIGRKIKGQYKHHNEDGMLKGVILSLIHEEKKTITQIAHRIWTKLSSVSEKIIEMEEKGLVEKVKDRDGRETFVELTPQGKAKIEQIMPIVREHCLEFLKALNDEEIETLAPLLKKLSA